MTNAIRNTLGRAMLVLLGGACAAMGAYAQGDVVVTAESIDVTPNGYSEITLSVQSADQQPTTLVLFYAYDASLLSPYTGYYETIARDALGNVQRDEDGEAITFRSAVRPEPALAIAGKSIDVQLYAQGVIGIAISGINDDPIPSGPVCTIGFRAQGGINPATTSTFRGITAGEPVTVTNPTTGQAEQAASSAAGIRNGNEVPLNIVFFGGTLLFACANSALPVTSLSASDSEDDLVALTWTNGGGGATEFRVFRSDSTDFATAQPLGNGWQVALSYSDFSAAASPGGSGNRGCFGGGGDATGTPQFYWVIARNAAGCESTPAGPVEGSRAPAGKALTETADASMMGNAAIALLLCGLLMAASRRRAASVR